MEVIVFIVILAVLVLVHEFGHFLAAKKQGIKVEEFGFGLPPRIFGKKIGETLYSLNWIPLGGFVRLYGEEYHELKNKSLSKKAFVNKKPWQKALVIFAGVVNNFLLGWILISFLFTQGVPVPTNKVIVDQVINGSPAKAAGLRSGDVVKSLRPDVPGAGKIVLKNTADMVSEAQKFAGKKIILTIERNQKQIEVGVVPRINPPSGQGALGIAITSYMERKYPWYQAPFYGLYESWNITKNIVIELSHTVVQLLTLHKPSADIAGPIGIARFTGQAIKFGKNAVLKLVALLSFNLAIVNILPFPALDGGRMVFVLYEWLTGKRANENLEKYTNLIGFFILIALAVVISIHDVINIYK